MPPSAKIIRRKNKTYSDGTNPIVLQVIYYRDSSIITLGEQYRCTPDQWNEEAREFNKKFENYKQKNIILRDYEARANRILEDFLKNGKPFTPLAFKELFTGHKKNVPTFYAFIDERINEMKNNNQLSNADIYKTTKLNLKKFEPKSNLTFSDVNYIFLTRFENFLVQNNNKGSIRNYMSSIRALFNEAMRRGLITIENFPFKNPYNGNGYDFSHIKSDAKPRALSEADLIIIKEFPYLEHPDLNFSYKIFMFTYYSRGMNINDIAKLKKENIYNDRIEYTRTKTKKPLSIRISEPLQKIINEFQNENSNFIFQILSDFHKTPQQIKYRIAKVTKQINDQLKEIAMILKIEISLTTYVARHTYATTLKRNGGDISKISELLGHGNVNITKAYLNKFENTETDKLDELL